MKTKNLIWTSNLILRTCQLCGNEDFQLISQQMQHQLDLNTVICKTCSFVFTNPLPEKSIYERFYADAYADYYGHLSPRFLGGDQVRLPEYISRKINWIANITPIIGKRLLEVGPGQGLFLSCAQQQGAAVIGIEPSPVFFEVLREGYLPCVLGSFENVDPSELGKFDFVVMFHVLEHFYDPNMALKQVREFLNDHGLFVLEVPNILKPFRSLDHYFLRYVHPSSFSRSTLEAFLQKFGFETVLVNDGGTDWRVPQNLFVIARKKPVYSKVMNSSSIWHEVVLHLEKYRRAWQHWGLFRWAFYELYLSLLRFVFLFGRIIKQRFFRS